MFSGAYNHSLDDKNRLLLPSEFREALAKHNIESVILTNGLDQCINGYLAEEWDALIRRVRRLPEMHELRVKYERIVIAFGKTIPVDKGGRILLTPELRKYNSIQKDIVLEGHGRIFEIWDAEKFEKKFMEDRTFLANERSALTSALYSKK